MRVPCDVYRCFNTSGDQCGLLGFEKQSSRVASVETIKKPLAPVGDEVSVFFFNLSCFFSFPYPMVCAFIFKVFAFLKF